VCAAYEQTAEEALEAALTDAEQACSRDTDCALRSFPTECAKNAGPFAIVVDRIEAFDAAVTNINTTTCSEFVDQGCVAGGVPAGEFGDRPRAACVDDVCVVRSALTADECRTRGVEDKRYVAYNTALEQADTACVFNADCTALSPGLSCLPECGLVVASQSAGAELYSQATPLAEVLCGELAIAGCDLSQPITCPDVALFPFGLGCIDGECRARTAAQDACEAIAEGAFDLIPLIEAAGTCVEDADCVAVSRATACVDSCYQYVTSSAALADFAEQSSLYEQSVCDRLELPENACEVPYAGFGCEEGALDPLVPVCTEGQCVALQ